MKEIIRNTIMKWIAKLDHEKKIGDIYLTEITDLQNNLVENIINHIRKEK